jgi:uncharacterized protein YbjT (DUF2867 family)
MTVLVVGATGGIGCLVAEEALRQGHTVRALVRTPGKARRLPPKAQVVRGDVTRPDTLSGAVDGVDAVVFTLGSDHALRKTFELIATTGPAPDDFDALFAPLDADPHGALDGVHDMANMPLEDEPRPVRDDLDTVLARRPAAAS